MKARLAFASLFVYFAIQINSKSYFLTKAKLLKENNFADVNLEFQEAVLPTVEVAYIVYRVA